MSRRKHGAPMSRDDLAQLYEYRPETGELIALKKFRRWAIGRRVGADNGTGHRRTHVVGRNYYTADLIWYLMTGDWPTFTIDHKDKDGLNDRWENLRPATSSENIFNGKIRKNNTSGIQGVCWIAERRRWQVNIQKNRRTIYVGRFEVLSDAVAARAEAEHKHYGSFAAEGP